MVVGKIILLTVYRRFQSERLIVEFSKINVAEITWLRSALFVISLICLPLVFWTRAIVTAESDAGKSLAIEVSSYLTLFLLALVGIAIIHAALWKSGAYQTAVQ